MSAVGNDPDDRRRNQASETANVAIVRRFYHEIWNDWRVDVADEIVSPVVRFRGSLGIAISGRDAFKAYVEEVRTAFPDWHNQIDELFAVDDRVVARLTWTGTHQGQFAGVEPTGKRVRYVGAAFFRVAAGLIREAWIVGDTQELWRTLGLLDH